MPTNDNDQRPDTSAGPSGRRARAKQSTAAASEKLTAAYDSVRERTAAAGQRAAEGIEAAPLAVLAGGIALGAIAGALLPRTDREVETLGPLGGKLTRAASDAVRAARDAGKEELGFLADAPQHPIQALVNKALGAATAAGGAAAASVGRKDKEAEPSLG